MVHGNEDFTMSDLIEEHLGMLAAEGRSSATITARRRCLRRLHDDLPHGILYACREQIVAWLGYDRWSAWTLHTYWTHVVEFYRWLHLHHPELLPADPTGALRRPRAPKSRPRPANPEQLAVAMSAPEPLLTAVLLARYQGLRRAEAAGCHREHVTEEVTVIHRAKGGSTQTVPTHPAVWQHVRDRPPGPLVAGPDGGELEPEELGALALRWFRRRGLRGFGLHQLRHLFGTEIQRAVRNLRVTQECLRHRSVRSTEIYTEVTDEERHDAVRRLPWVEHRPAADGPVPPAGGSSGG